MPSVKSKRVLIVDDEFNLALTLSAGLEKLWHGYVFEIAQNGQEALLKLRQTTYDLIITDHSMPGMTGLELLRSIRQATPGTPVVLMTGHGTDKLKDQASDLNAAGYIDKPFSLEQIQEIVKRAIGVTQKARLEAETQPDQTPHLDRLIDQHLKSLQHYTGAQCVLLLSSGGYPVGVVGQAANLDVSSIGALVAGNFMAAAELANLLGSNRSVFKSSYYEGADYNIYSYDINGKFLLAVIFGANSKPGTVWFYTKQVAAQLDTCLADYPLQITFAPKEVDLALEVGFDDLFQVETPGNNGVTEEVNRQRPQIELQPDPPDREKPPARRREREPSVPLTFEQAVAAGLVPPKLVKREEENGK